MLAIPPLDTYISFNFQLKDALYLMKWNTYAYPNQDQLDNIIFTAEKMDEIFDLFEGKKIVNHSWFRTQCYNEFIGSTSALSQHTQGKANDFHIDGVSCDDVREKLTPLLDKLNIRMENNKGKNWVHIDTKIIKPGEARLF
jgi:hypothetical protein